MKGQQPDQVAVLAEVVFYFRPEVQRIFGKEKTYKQVGVVNQGPFMKVIAGTGSNIEGQELFHLDVIAGIKLIPGTIQVAETMPPRMQPN